LQPLFLFQKALTEAKASSPLASLLLDTTNTTPGLDMLLPFSRHQRPPRRLHRRCCHPSLPSHAISVSHAISILSAKVVAGNVVHHRSRHRRRRKPTFLSFSLARSTPALGAARVRLLLTQKPRTAIPVATASHHCRRRHHRRHPVLRGAVVENPGMLGLCFLFAYHLEQPLCDTQGRGR